MTILQVRIKLSKMQHSDHMEIDGNRYTAEVVPSESGDEYVDIGIGSEWGNLSNTMTKLKGNMVSCSTPIVLHNNALTPLIPEYPKFEIPHSPWVVLTVINAPQSCLAGDSMGASLLRLGKLFSEQYSSYKQTSDLELAILFQWFSVQFLHDQDMFDLAIGYLLLSLTDRFALFSEMAQLYRIISVAKWGLNHCGTNPSSQGTVLAHLAYLLTIGYKRYGKGLNDHEAFSLCRGFFDKLAEDRTYRLVTTFRGLIYEHFRLFSDVDNLHEAVQLSYESLTLCPMTDILEHRQCYQALGQAHLQRFKVLHHPTDLDEAVTQTRESFKFQPKDYTQENLMQDTYRLASIIHMRYEAWRDPVDLADCIQKLREVVDTTSDGHPDYHASLLLLVRCLIQNRDQEGALVLLRRSPTGGKGELMLEVAQLWRMCFEQHPTVSDESLINEAIHILQAFLHRSDLSTHLQTKIKLELGLSHIARFKLLCDNTDATSAARWLMESIVEHPNSSALRALVEVYLDQESPIFDVGIGLSHLAPLLGMGDLDHMELLHFAYQKLLAVDPSLNVTMSSDQTLLLKLSLLLGHAANIQLHINSRLAALHSLDDFVKRFLPLAMEKLCCAGLLSEALDFLDRTRGLFWSQTLCLRTDINEVPPSFRDRFRLLSNHLELITGSYAPLTWDAPDPAYNSLRIRVKAEFDQLVDQIRATPGKECFLKPAPVVEMLSKKSKSDIIVTLFVCSDCSRALIVQRKSEHEDLVISSLELDGLTEDNLGILAVSVTRSSRGEAEEVSSPQSNDSVNQESKDEKGACDTRAIRLSKGLSLVEILAKIWQKIVKHIIQKLGLNKRVGHDRPRLWWCPTGHFMFLPLHAAGMYTMRSDCFWYASEQCSDYVVSSYTPTLATLANGRHSFEPLAYSDMRMLLTAVPYPYQGTLLRGTSSELQRIASVIPSSLRITLCPEDDTLLDPKAGTSVNTILDNLRDATLFHLASHGVQDATNPLDSAFIMRDGRLTISSLMHLPQPRAFLAFLSACETAKNAQGQSNEAIHLVASMLFVGFKSAIGTMWPMADIDGPDVAEMIYQQLLTEAMKNPVDCDVIPYALDDATRAMQQKGLPPDRWAQFVHYGI
ncbi:hypothetical protein GYMLUDRAFT_264562 [Collybiopsis luxurians FD-317 M1]|uniref:CHAT domain-containing protein n=1 Tax=Collybiopsis luxurians FD-317 M1 TaxID=944289 RepID=A0A0D0AVU8_9AGAR|nr:hypothetical protein GYMLUDRAFT_264562 [Collybiopsis luxurians FD-317 M1]